MEAFRAYIKSEAKVKERDIGELFEDARKQRRELRELIDDIKKECEHFIRNERVPETIDNVVNKFKIIQPKLYEIGEKLKTIKNSELNSYINQVEPFRNEIGSIVDIFNEYKNKQEYIFILPDLAKSLDTNGQLHDALSTTLDVKYEFKKLLKTNEISYPELLNTFQKFVNRTSMASEASIATDADLNLNNTENTLLAAKNVKEMAEITKDMADLSDDAARAMVLPVAKKELKPIASANTADAALVSSNISSNHAANAKRKYLMKHTDKYNADLTNTVGAYKSIDDFLKSKQPALVKFGETTLMKLDENTIVDNKVKNINVNDIDSKTSQKISTRFSDIKLSIQDGQDGGAGAGIDYFIKEYNYTKEIVKIADIVKIAVDSATTQVKTSIQSDTKLGPKIKNINSIIIQVGLITSQAVQDVSKLNGYAPQGKFLKYAIDINHLIQNAKIESMTGTTPTTDEIIRKSGSEKLDEALVIAIKAYDDSTRAKYLATRTVAIVARTNALTNQRNLDVDLQTIKDMFASNAINISAYNRAISFQKQAIAAVKIANNAFKIADECNSQDTDSIKATALSIEADSGIMTAVSSNEEVMKSKNEMTAYIAAAAAAADPGHSPLSVNSPHSPPTSPPPVSSSPTGPGPFPSTTPGPPSPVISQHSPTSHPPGSVSQSINSSQQLSHTSHDKSQLSPLSVNSPHSPPTSPPVSSSPTGPGPFPSTTPGPPSPVIFHHSPTSHPPGSVSQSINSSQQLSHTSPDTTVSPYIPPSPIPVPSHSSTPLSAVSHVNDVSKCLKEIVKILIKAHHDKTNEQTNTSTEDAIGEAWRHMKDAWEKMSDTFKSIKDTYIYLEDYLKKQVKQKAEKDDIEKEKKDAISIAEAASVLRKPPVAPKENEKEIIKTSPNNSIACSTDQLNHACTKLFTKKFDEKFKGKVIVKCVQALESFLKSIETVATVKTEIYMESCQLIISEIASQKTPDKNEHEREVFSYVLTKKTKKSASKILKQTKKIAKQYFQYHFDLLFKKIKSKIKYINKWMKRGDAHITYKRYEDLFKRYEVLMGPLDIKKVDVEKDQAGGAESQSLFDHSMDFYKTLLTNLQTNWVKIPLATLDQSDREDLYEQKKETQDYIQKLLNNLSSFYNNDIGIMDIIMDSQFITMYILKLITYVFFTAAFYLAEKLFSEMYMKAVYADGGDPPNLALLMFMTFGLHFAFVLFLLTILMLFYFLFKNNQNNFMISKELIISYLADYGLCMLTILLISCIITMTVQNKRYFKYKTEGLRAVRATRDIMSKVVFIIFAVPFFAF